MLLGPQLWLAAAVAAIASATKVWAGSTLAAAITTVGAVVATATTVRAASSGLPPYAISHILDDGSAIPLPNPQFMTDPLLSSVDAGDDDLLFCPDECRCDNGAAVECWNVASIPDLLAVLKLPTVLSITYCDGRQWLDPSGNSTRRKVHQPALASSPSLLELSLSGCPVDDEQSDWLDRLLALPQLEALRQLRIVDSLLTTVRLSPAVLGRRQLVVLDLPFNKLREVIISQEESSAERPSALSQLSLAENQLISFDLPALVAAFPRLERLNLSGNSLEDIVGSSRSTTAAATASQLRQLDLSRNPQLELVCNAVLFLLLSLVRLDLSYTGLKAMPTLVFELEHLEELRLEGTVPRCDCRSALQLSQSQQHRWNNLTAVFDGMECSLMDGETRRLDDPEILSMLSCEGAVIQEVSNDTEVLAGSELLLDCAVSGSPPAEVLWLTPRLELIKFVPDLDQSACPPLKQELALSPTTLADYSTWENHFRVLSNGSLLIDEFGWRDRGVFQCYAENGFGNATERVEVKLNYHYRNRIYYLSLAFGFGGAGCFLGLTLLAKLLHYLLWNYGCCLCCACCKNQLPPKTKKLTEVVDSIETYRIQQLEKLRENYHQQSQRIRDNCALQMERVRENYSNQVRSVKEVKNYGSAQCQSVKDNYYEQIARIREYSTSQLDKCHENYLFQRQRLRKFSAQNYLKIRETRKYTQKTLNRVLDNMPALYLDLSSCRQGFGDQDIREWQEEMERKEAEMREILDIERDQKQHLRNHFPELGDSQSLYFTPAGTPLREAMAAARAEMGGGDPYEDVYYSSSGGVGSPAISPTMSPDHVASANNQPGGSGKKVKRSHKRGVSSLSNFLPFWWGMNQQDTVQTTVAIVENRAGSEDTHNNPTAAAPASDSEAAVLLDRASYEEMLNVVSDSEDAAFNELAQPVSLDNDVITANGSLVHAPDDVITANGSLTHAQDELITANGTADAYKYLPEVQVVSAVSGKRMSLAEARAEFFNSTTTPNSSATSQC